MIIKSQNLYINEKNILTLKPYVTNSTYGLEINGVNYKFGEMQPDKDLQSAKMANMKALCTQIIKRLEK